MIYSTVTILDDITDKRNYRSNEDLSNVLVGFSNNIFHNIETVYRKEFRFILVFFISFADPDIVSILMTENKYAYLIRTFYKYVLCPIKHESLFERSKNINRFTLW